jgi:Replication-relaxation
VSSATASGRPAGRRPLAVRPRADQSQVASVARRLTPRDRLVCRTLFDHKVLTTEQVTDLCFDNLTTARHRLTALYELRVLDRFRPFRPVGSDPYHYLLDTLGVEIVAADRAVEVPRPGLNHSRALALADSQRLAHFLGINGLFCALARWARTVEDGELVEWWPERRCASEWGEVVRPDGFGTLRQRTRVVEFFIELDRDTETLARLADKLTGYAQLVHATGWAPLVCFWFPSPGREAEARRVLAHPEVPVATSTAGLGDGPGGPVWLPVGSTGPRRHLIDLATAGRRS